jgi:hypothetical protein
MNHTATEQLRRLIIDANAGGNLEINEVLDVLRTADNDLGYALGDLRRTVAAAPDPDLGWRLFVPLARAAPESDAEPVFIVGSNEFESTTWKAVQDDPSYWLTPDSLLSGIDDTSEIRFSFDGDAWEGTTFSFAFYEGEWQLEIDGALCSFDLSAMDIRYSFEWPVAETGMWIEIAEGGTSMTTGDIGVTVRIDERGLWVDSWGGDLTFHGRVGLDFSAYDYLPRPIGSVESVTSEVFDPPQMRTLLKHLGHTVVNSFDPSDVHVACVGFEGTAAELLAAASGG